MNNIEKAITYIHSISCSSKHPAVDVRMQLVVTLGFIAVVLCVPLDAPDRLVWLFCFPIVMAEALGIGYSRVFRDSLVVLPLIILIGIFNPFIDRVPFWQIWGITVSRGWVTFAATVLRGLLSLQALLVLVYSCGFNDMCKAFSRFGMPNVLVTQLLMLFRFLTVLLEEALIMHRARQARGFGRKSYPLALWGTFIGQLILRSFSRAQRVNRAMLARGFNGEIHFNCAMRQLRLSDWAYLIVWAVVFAAIRLLDFSTVFNKLL